MIICRICEEKSKKVLNKGLCEKCHKVSTWLANIAPGVFTGEDRDCVIHLLTEYAEEMKSLTKSNAKK